MFAFLVCLVGRVDCLVIHNWLCKFVCYAFFPFFLLFYGAGGWGEKGRCQGVEGSRGQLPYYLFSHVYVGGHGRTPTRGSIGGWRESRGGQMVSVCLPLTCFLYYNFTPFVSAGGGGRLPPGGGVEGV